MKNIPTDTWQLLLSAPFCKNTLAVVRRYAVKRDVGSPCFTSGQWPEECACLTYDYWDHAHTLSHTSVDVTTLNKSYVGCLLRWQHLLAHCSLQYITSTVTTRNCLSPVQRRYFTWCWASSRFPLAHRESPRRWRIFASSSRLASCSASRRPVRRRR